MSRLAWAPTSICVLAALTTLTIAGPSAPLAAQYFPGDLIVMPGVYDPTRFHHHPLVMDSSGRFTTLAMGVKWGRDVKPSADNRTMWISDLFTGLRQEHRLYEWTPRGVLRTLAYGAHPAILGVDDAGDTYVLRGRRGNDVLRYAPRSGISTIFSRGDYAAGAIDPTSGDLVVYGSGGYLARIDPRSGAVTTFIPPGTTFARSRLVATPTTGHVVAIEPRARSLALIRVSPPSSLRLALPSGTGPAQSISEDLRGGLFLSMVNGTLFRVDPLTSTFVRSIPVPPGTDATAVAVAHSRHLAGATRPARGGPYHVRVSSLAEVGVPYVVAASFNLGRGVLLPGGRRISLEPDTLFFYSLTNSGVFSGFQGLLNARGEAIATVSIPKHAALAGLRFYLACATFPPSGIGVVSAPITVTVR